MQFGKTKLYERDAILLPHLNYLPMPYGRYGTSFFCYFLEYCGSRDLHTNITTSNIACRLGDYVIVKTKKLNLRKIIEMVNFFIYLFLLSFSGDT